MSERPEHCRVVVLISGRGSNLQSLIDAWQAGDLAIEPCAVISNEPGARGLDRAQAAGIPTAVVEHQAYQERTAFSRALREAVDSFAPNLVVLAGFMRVLSGEFVDHYAGRLLNIHPSLLPRYPGLDTHRRAIEAGDVEHGASVHFVTQELDNGPVIVQARVPILPGDTEETLAARVLHREHQIYPLAVRWFAEGRLGFRDGAALLDGKPVLQPLLHEAGGEAVSA